MLGQACGEVTAEGGVHCESDDEVAGCHCLLSTASWALFAVSTLRGAKECVGSFLEVRGRDSEPYWIPVPGLGLEGQHH